MTKSNGLLLWKGESLIDGSPIVLIATGLKKASGNAKTGEMVQTWILRADMSPVEAVASGEDRAICGDCPHRGRMEEGKNVARSCYVTVFQGPRSIYQAFMGGKYPVHTYDESAEILAGLNVRLGAYGDPAAIPFHVWEKVLTKAGRCTGYTHQWQWCDSRFSRYCMASADSLLESSLAQDKGYRTFRVGSFAESLVKGKEILCPASKEAGKKLDCAACLACGGNSSPNKAGVFIHAHGIAPRVKAFAERGKVVAA